MSAHAPLKNPVSNPLEGSVRLADWAHWVLNPVLALLALLAVAVFVLQHKNIELARSLQQQAEQQLRQSQPKRPTRPSPVLALAKPTEEELWPAFGAWLEQHRVAAGQCSLHRGLPLPGTNASDALETKLSTTAPTAPTAGTGPTASVGLVVPIAQGQLPLDPAPVWHLQCQGWPVNASQQAQFKPMLLSQGLETALGAWALPASLLGLPSASSNLNPKGWGRGRQSGRARKHAASPQYLGPSQAQPGQAAQQDSSAASPSAPSPSVRVEGWVDTPRGRLSFNPKTQRWQP